MFEIIGQIFAQNILPIFILIGLGFLLGCRLPLDVRTLTRINLMIFVPAFTFSNLYRTPLRRDTLSALLFAFCLLVANLLLSAAAARLLGYDLRRRKAFQNAITFYNSGNIGIPLITLVFADAAPEIAATALATQVMVLVVQNITTNSLGFYNASCANLPWQAALREAFRMPTVYAVPLALLCKALPVDLTQAPGWPALNLIAGGLVPVALLTLGVQLARTKVDFGDRSVPLASLMRLLGGPLIAFGLIRLLGLSGVTAHVLFISSSVPTAVNTALIAADCGNEPDFATQTVLVTTLACAASLVLVIYLAGVLFPV